MTPKEKAEEIWDRMIYHIMYNCQPTLSSMIAKQCAIIAVNEVLGDASKKNSHIHRNGLSDYDYWWEVKQEIEKL
jgi:hypothetical protein